MLNWLIEINKRILLLYKKFFILYRHVYSVFIFLPLTPDSAIDAYQDRVSWGRWRLLLGLNKGTKKCKGVALGWGRVPFLSHPITKGAKDKSMIFLFFSLLILCVSLYNCWFICKDVFTLFFQILNISPAVKKWEDAGLPTLRD